MRPQAPRFPPLAPGALPDDPSSVSPFTKMKEGHARPFLRDRVAMRSRESRAVGGGSVADEAVAETGLRRDELGLAPALLQLHAEIADVAVDDIARDRALAAPDVREDVLA